jgi:hypothetical protein
LNNHINKIKEFCLQNNIKFDDNDPYIKLKNEMLLIDDNLNFDNNLLKNI